MLRHLASIENGKGSKFAGAVALGAVFVQYRRDVALEYGSGRCNSREPRKYERYAHGQRLEEVSFAKTILSRKYR